MTRRAQWVLAVYVVAFAVGTADHVTDILREGLVPRNRYHWGFNAFWTALAVLDPLVIWLLLRRQRAGLLLAGLVMFFDVAVNLTVGLRDYRATGRFLMWGLATQIPFALFVLATAPLLWSAFDEPRGAESWRVP